MRYSISRTAVHVIYRAIQNLSWVTRFGHGAIEAIDMASRV